MKAQTKFIILMIFISLFCGALAALLVINYLPMSYNQEIKEFYTIEHVSSVSPSDYISDLKNGKVDGTLVDLRTPAEYDAGHLVTAINIPASQMNESELITAYEQLPTDKPVINYCYTEYCMLSINVGEALADNGIYTEHMTAGWYELNRDFSAYIVNGTSPGALNASQYTNSTLCSTNVTGGFSC